MYPAEIFRDTLSRLLVILTNHKVRFHLTGGITSVAYGEPAQHNHPWPPA